MSALAAAPQSRPIFRSVVTTDVDDQAGVTTYGEWTQAYEQLSSGPYRGCVEDIELAPLTLLREASNCIILETGSVKPDSYAIGLPLQVSGDVYFCGSILKPGCVTLLNPSLEFEMRTCRDFDLVAAAFNPAVLCQHLEDPTVDAAELAHDLSRLPSIFENPVAAELTAFLTRLLDAARQHADILTQATAQHQIADEFHGLMSSCLSACDGGHAYRVREGRDRLVRRVRKYLERSWEEPVNIADICRDLSVTRRTLQNAIQEVLGVSPQNYLKAIRLNGVRRALKNPALLHQTIADVACHWGFWHLSQFAQDYRRLFGELPSLTRQLALVRQH